MSLNLTDYLDMIDRVKDEYTKGDLIMSELLRNEEFNSLFESSRIYLLEWAGEDEYAESTLDMTNSITSTIDGFEIRAKEIADGAYKNVWRLIKKTRWQGHYNTRKRSRRF